MTDSTRVTILFTANLRADFEVMPLLATSIRQARMPASGEIPQPVLLIDLGGAWAGDEPICQITQNRAPYLILDAMGYHVARADGLDVAGILGLHDTVHMTLMDDSIVYQWQAHDVAINIGPQAEAPAVVWPLLEVAAHQERIAHSQDGMLTLYPPTGYLGKVMVWWPSMTIIQAERIPISPNRPDPSIIEVVKFVENEAQAYGRRQQKGGTP